MTQGREEAGRCEEPVSDQESLKVLDDEDDSVLMTKEVADGLGRFGKRFTSAGVRHRLDELAEPGLVERKESGARAIGWWAIVAPELNPEVAKKVDERREGNERVEV